MRFASFTVDAGIVQGIRSCRSTRKCLGRIYDGVLKLANVTRIYYRLQDEATIIHTHASLHKRQKKLQCDASFVDLQEEEQEPEWWYGICGV